MLKQRFYRFIDVPLTQSFKQFRLGGVIFFAGLVIIYAASQLFEPSLTQELVTLVGLLVVGLGFIIAILAQIRMMLGRFMKFCQTPKD